MVLTGGCGAFGPSVSLVALNDNETEEAACLDLWSLAHIGSGYVIGTRLDDDSAAPTLAMLVAWEIAESGVWPGFNESGLNQSCDIVVGMLGWLIESLAQP